MDKWMLSSQRGALWQLFTCFSHPQASPFKICFVMLGQRSCKVSPPRLLCQLTSEKTPSVGAIKRKLQRSLAVFPVPSAFPMSRRQPRRQASASHRTPSSRTVLGLFRAVSFRPSSCRHLNSAYPTSCLCSPSFRSGGCFLSPLISKLPHVI